MDLRSFVIGMVAGLVLAAILFALRRPRGASLDSPPAMPPRPRTALLDNLDEGVKREIADLLACKKKIAAIKLLREATGCGLKEAKELVDRMY